MQRSSSYSAFIGGHIAQYQVNTQQIESVLIIISQGIKKVCIPNDKWTGYGFVEFRSQPELDHFLALGSFLYNGNEISIKPIARGDSLAKIKQDYDLKRLFIRIRAKTFVNPDLFGYFSQFGSVEKVQLLLESEIITSEEYTIMGFVIFKDVNVAQQLSKNNRVLFDDFTLVINKIKRFDDRPATQQFNSRKNHENFEPLLLNHQIRTIQVEPRQQNTRQEFRDGQSYQDNNMRFNHFLLHQQSPDILNNKINNTQIDEQKLKRRADLIAK